MKLTVLIDNHTFIDHYYYGEPGVCYYIEDDDTRLLLDLGYSHIFIENAALLGIDLQKIQKIIFSHGHNDHTGGLSHFARQFDLSEMELVAHPNALLPKILHGDNIGAPMDVDDLEKRCNVVLSKVPVKVSQNITFLGEIPSSNTFEQRRAIGQTFKIDKTEGDSKITLEDDFVYDDSALVYAGEKGLYIITGCAHSGICNIIEYAKRVCGDQRVVGVIGGFHLFEVNQRVEETIAYFKQNGIEELYPCHCVAFPVRAEIHRDIPVKDVGVGLQLEWV